jgi:hypothetical protein
VKDVRHSNKSPFKESISRQKRTGKHDGLNNWYRERFSRLLVDMHIPDWDSRFLSKLNPRRYVETVAKSRAGVIMLYCNSHIGLALYPSKVGPVHRAIGDGDFTGDVLKLAHKKGLAVVAYYSAVFNNAAFLEHPEWRIVPAQGEALYEHSRYGTCCPNSPYSEFAVAQTEEICSRYDFDGIFFDMLFWPYACYCPHCQARFEKEKAQALPRTVDWNAPVWVSYTRARERWMSELAGKLTAVVHRVAPSMTVTHQMSPVLHGWKAAMPYSITEHCDYASGDFYGPPVQQSVVCKIFSALSRKHPFEFMTSRCTDLRDHVTTKPRSEMEMQAFLAPAHAAAFMFIDAIDPVGTLNKKVYERIGGVFEKMTPYEKYLGGSSMAEVAIYVSSESRFDFHENGIDMAGSSRRADNMGTEFAGQHMEAVMGAARSLQEAHIPYSVVTRQNISELARYRVVLLTNVLLMDDEETAAFERYVRNGGALYASGYSSLVDGTGRVRKNFALAKVFGVSAQGKMNDAQAFFTPTDARLKTQIEPQEQFIHFSGWLPVAQKGARALASLTRCWYPEKDGTVLKPSFASIHSSPPSLEATGPGIVFNRLGKGHVIYAAGPIEGEKQKVNRRIVAHLVRELLRDPVAIEAVAPAFVELTAFDKSEQHRINISLVSLRQEEEPIPCSGKVLVRLDKGKRLKTVRRLPDRRQVATQSIPGGIEFSFHDFEVFSMYELEYINS